MKPSGIKRGDPEKRREFIDRGRASGARSLRESARQGLKRRARKREAEGPLSPARWKEEAYRLSDGTCIITGQVARDPFDRRFSVHHPVPKRELRARGLYAHVWDARNAVWLLVDVHMAHEASGPHVPRGRLPARVWEFAAEMDRFGPEGSQWATALVERFHPADAEQSD